MSKDAIDNNLRQVIRDLTRRISALERQQNDVGRLDELSSDMGLQTAGEFRAGNGVEPGEGFSGVRMTADGVSGYDNDVLQSQMSATDGKITAGAGAVVLNSSGVSVTNIGEFQAAHSYKFLDDDDNYSGGMYSDGGGIYVEHIKSGMSTEVAIRSRADNSHTAGASIGSYRYNNSAPPAYFASALDSSGVGTIEIQAGNQTGGTVKINPNSYDVDTIIYSDTGAVLTVDGGDNDVDIATKLNFSATGAITGGSETINDDAAFSFTPATARGVLIFRTGGAGSTTYGMFTYAATAGTAYCYAWTGAGSAMVAATGALSGTTGTDTKVTVSAHTDGKLYIENRSGGNLNCAWQIVAGT
jgi:hypothetical protein